MKIRTIGRHVREGTRNLFRNGWMTFASISAVAVTLFILGGSILLSLNVQNISLNIESQLQINAYVSNTVPVKALPALEKRLSHLRGVRSVRFVSKVQALKQMKKLLKSNADIMAGLGNPLPNAYILNALNPQETAAVAKEVQNTPGIESVQYGQSFLPKLLTIMNVARDAAVILIGGLLVLGMFLISNTIRITIFTRRREIEIMKLVGATNGFIRGPFFVEGTLMGLVGAAIPSVALYELYRWISQTVQLFPPFTLVPYSLVVTHVVWVLVACGLFMGIWGSLFSMRRFLRV
ncbi:permease-like cell division protein FtsX [Ferroacidibacillus organovorans]|uniref:Cell division protein FtsX n=1 Tax=Ferroacidibacillus organovorans TaxID=1765683 RepID=A0A124IVV3_9BACL|nr:permease-like cell division protein FtsX [Ferroacidibacillus organovorans]KUO95435.1 hypothetical protein ATW55_02945 [Ferroacidibacillus organovorans]